METIQIIPKMTFAIASKNNFRYVKYAVQYIRENCYRKDHIIHIGIDGEDTDLWDWVIEQINNGDDNIMVSAGKSGIAAIYNDIARKLPTDFIVIYHADMIAGKDMDLNLYKQWKKGLVVSATRIEPPLHPSNPSKIIENFGMWPEEEISDGFQKQRFNDFVEHNLDNDKLTKGVFAPWLIHKDDYWAVGGHDEEFNSHSEDRDLFNRFLLNGFDFVQPWNALVYHLTCRAGQFENANNTEDLKNKSKDWTELQNLNTQKFIKKWGTHPLYDEYQYPIVFPKYNMGLNLINGNEEMKNFFKPFFDVIEINNNDIKTDILVEVNANLLTNNNFHFLMNLPQIIKYSGEIGKMGFDIFTLYIKSLTEYQNELIKVN